MFVIWVPKKTEVFESEEISEQRVSEQLFKTRELKT